MAVCGKDKNNRRLDKDQSAVLKKTSDMVFDAKIGFSLVQGPPGTGKTTLLRGLLNVLHNAATQAYYDAVLNVVNSVAAQEVRSSASAQHNKSEGPAGAAGLLAQIAQHPLTQLIQSKAGEIRRQFLRADLQKKG